MLSKKCVDQRPDHGGAGVTLLAMPLRAASPELEQARTHYRHTNYDA